MILKPFHHMAQMTTMTTGQAGVSMTFNWNPKRQILCLIYSILFFYPLKLTCRGSSTSLGGDRSHKMPLNKKFCINYGNIKFAWFKIMISLEDFLFSLRDSKKRLIGNSLLEEREKYRELNFPVAFKIELYIN